MFSHQSMNQVDHLEKYESDLLKNQLSYELPMKMLVVSWTKYQIIIGIIEHRSLARQMGKPFFN